jgi:hypothetical protein
LICLKFAESRGSVAHEQGARSQAFLLRLRHATACNVRYGRSSERAGQRLATIRQINRYARDIAFHGSAGSARRLSRRLSRPSVIRFYRKSRSSKARRRGGRFWRSATRRSTRRAISTSRRISRSSNRPCWRASTISRCIGPTCQPHLRHPVMCGRPRSPPFHNLSFCESAKAVGGTLALQPNVT